MEDKQPRVADCTNTLPPCTLYLSLPQLYLLVHGSGSIAELRGTYNTALNGMYPLFSAEPHLLTCVSQGTVNKLVQRFGLTEVYAPTPANSALVDIVFVHGLNGDPHNTWTSSPSNVFWPADLLPQFVEDQKARVLVYGYDADVSSLAGSGTTKDRIHNHAERLVADLFANRRVRETIRRLSFESFEANMEFSQLTQALTDPQSYREAHYIRRTFAWRACGEAGGFCSHPVFEQVPNLLTIYTRH